MARHVSVGETTPVKKVNIKKRQCNSTANLGSWVGDQLRSVEVVAVERGAARVAISPWTGTQRLSKIQSNVNGIANLLDRAFR